MKVCVERLVGAVRMQIHEDKQMQLRTCRFIFVMCLRCTGACYTYCGTVHVYLCSPCMSHTYVCMHTHCIILFIALDSHNTSCIHIMPAVFT